MDLSKYMGIFRAEAETKLKELNDSLLVLEQDPENIEHINIMFRSAHTLKGMAATMGFRQIVELTHEMESLMDRLRTGQSKLDEALTDILFECLDALEELVESACKAGKPGESGSESGLNSEIPPETARVLKALRALTTETSGTHPEEIASSTVNGEYAQREELHGKELQEKELHGETFPLSSDSAKGPEFSEKEQELIKEAEKEGSKVLLAHVTLEETCLMKAARSALVIRKFSENGNIIKTIPALDELENERFGFDFEVIFSTKKDEAAIKKEICRITEVKNLIFNHLVPGLEKSSENTLSEEVEREAERKEKKGDQREIERGVERETERGISERNVLVSPRAGQKIKSIQSVRVSTDQLDKLMNLAGELVISRSRINQLTRDWKSKELDAALSEFQKLTREIQEEVIEARMVPLDQVFNMFPRMIRDLAREENKKIDFIIKGKEIKLDRTVLDEIGDPLVHLLRNAVDHGIESPKKRLELGKKESGTIMLTALRQENHVLIKIEDDGHGIDTEKLRKAAVEKKIISCEEAEQLSEREALQLIFAQGFSTASRVTDISGRGVGMDVVKTRVEHLGGSVRIESKSGIGSRFVLKLPLTIALYQAMLVEVGEEKYAIPFINITKNIEIGREELRHIRGEEVLISGEKVLPLLRLRRLFQLPPDSEKERFTVVIAEKAGQPVGIVVDKLLGKQEVIIKNFKSKLLEKTGGFAGATILGDGNVILILDINTLV